MGKRRCAFERSRFAVSEFKELSGYLVHVQEDGSPVEPAHEAVEGRRLTLVDDQWVAEGLDGHLPTPSFRTTDADTP